MKKIDVKATNETESLVEKKTKKKIGKNTLLAIIASFCAVLIIVAIVVPVVIVYGDKATVPSPEFYNYNDETDYYIKVKWNKIKNADSYSYIYYYGDPSEVDESTLDIARTQNTNTAFPRHKGMVAFKVKADIAGEKTEYSDWITLNVSAWKLQQPILTVSDEFEISWTVCTFKADDKTYNVSGYEYNIIVDGTECFPQDIYVDTTIADIKNFIKNYLNNTDKIMGYNLGEDWQDIAVEIRVKAVAYVKFAGVVLKNPSFPNDVLMNIYENSDYGTVGITITEDVYKSL